MKRWSAAVFALVLIVSILSGCGAKSEKDVVQNLSKKIENINSYQTDATMTFQHNGKKQTYQAHISFQKPYYYRVALSDGNKGNNQMILRNSDGVFVLTPELNKSYRFESNWPNNRSQAYLYHSLAKDILNDPNPGFTAKENQYVFNTKTNYNTAQLSNQQIALNKDLTPVNVRILDKDQNIIVTVVFKNFKVNPSLDKSIFDVNKNMTAARIGQTKAAQAAAETFKVQYPTARISGSTLSSMTPETTQAGEKYVLKYGGQKPFTLIESKSSAAASDVPVLASGDPANLGFSIGSVNNNTLTWSYGGTDYFLASDKLTQDELITVAQSMNGTVVK
ncbi:outer membrane lipoprotein carrier protein LolA [Sporolactobacillus sp. CQH2019]|uniref:LolA family protein n=1 Tax=Sporolactobacillus sp. CQH2019 TaxID=3023512 RepID=UPI002367B751|nr:outer membrane lipoprotein carrier protein LolA [Sporolactobacillus sp. CQH2019]MDD9150758.1 outer membrane lipoprotein carrier protein LolA [Sporolactobacillus sp. CQH2019]